MNILHGGTYLLLLLLSFRILLLLFVGLEDQRRAIKIRYPPGNDDDPPKEQDEHQRNDVHVSDAHVSGFRGQGDESGCRRFEDYELKNVVLERGLAELFPMLIEEAEYSVLFLFPNI